MSTEGLDCWDDYPMEHGCICGNACPPPSGHPAAANAPTGDVCLSCSGSGWDDGAGEPCFLCGGSGWIEATEPQSDE